MSRHTLAAPATHSMEIKHSRFIACAAPIASDQAAAEWLRAVTDPEATHNCWAWRVGDDYRSNDDGEPAGTAGRPILAAIDGQGFDRIAVVVTRWYGGIKLGAGGLVRAYGGTAAECLRNAAHQPIIAITDAEVVFGFADTGAVHAALSMLPLERLGETFDALGTRLRIRLPQASVAELEIRLRDATRGRASVTVSNDTFQ